MPRIRWSGLPPALRDHLFDRLRERKITAEQGYAGTTMHDLLSRSQHVTTIGAEQFSSGSASARSPLRPRTLRASGRATGDRRRFGYRAGIQTFDGAQCSGATKGIEEYASVVPYMSTPSMTNGNSQSGSETKSGSTSVRVLNGSMSPASVWSARPAQTAAMTLAPQSFRKAAAARR
jgi:hypothetical protein